MGKNLTDNRFNVFGYIVATFFSLLCLVPFWMVITASFTEEQSILQDGYGLFPKVFSLDAYKQIFKFPKTIADAYGVSIGITLAGSLIGLFIISMTAYVLLCKDFKYRNHFAFFFYFTTLFSGGLVPYYILMVKYLQLKDHYAALILPGMLSAFNIILMRNFMKSIPESIFESAKIDGAGEFTIFLKFVLPLSKPGLATIGLFLALGYWNDWFQASLFIGVQRMYPLQYYLFKTLIDTQVMKSLTFTGVDATTVMNMPTESYKMATAVIATGPIIAVYPFIQKYIVRGLTVGAVKG